jgi:putative two-component system response regulator
MKVVIVDDMPLVLTLLRHLVSKLPDCEPCCFSDPLAALEWCMQNEPDLIVADFDMPRMDGAALLETVRLRHPDVPVLMITSSPAAELRYRVLHLGTSDFLTKPLDNVEFVARAANLLSMHAQHKTISSRADALAGEIQQTATELINHQRTALVCLSRAARYRDPETGAHIQRMAHYCRHIARNLGLPQDRQDLLLDAAPMHDVGKVGVPDAILLKPAKLDPPEFLVMQQHAAIGHAILSRTRSPLLDMAAQIAYTHHEKYDGTGYPRGLAGEQIPVVGRIAAVADVYDALTSRRPYKEAWAPSAAADYLVQGIGSHFDPACVRAFLEGWDEVMDIRQQFSDDEGAHPRSGKAA